ncbi:uncharacterized protein LOC126614412 isoform X3 [Malus sylvestris]|uniref:uncharacterized protein LOC126614412 isoform X3 n=1 Tax=Malus sylvestris TaxID=3752 RepID=UPI0021ABB1F5|nr:uncharacterized protein LOC126614412 isoform X3 [Malus sylvestris]
MGQIVRRKKKGRPSKADLARRSGELPAKTAKKESDVRRSLRRRNVKYNIDYDDYLDEDDEEDEEEDERRREKKVKLVVKLDQAGNRSARDSHAQDSGGDEDEDEEDGESERKQQKRRRINGGDDSDKDDDGIDEDDDDCEERCRKADSKRPDSPPGAPSDPNAAIPLPDKKTLELILDKLQKKDTYGVYAEPVDPEELPDYHEVIERPMDFATVRKQLANGLYSTLEQFEGDVFLICSNAMEYNSSDTIYYKQACSIQELAKRKFDRLRSDYERLEKELKLVQKTKSNSLVKKQTKKPLCRTLQEPIGSDFSSGATLATAVDVQNTSLPTQGSGCERPSNIDGPVEGNSSLNEANVEKPEDMSSGKGLLSKVGRKPSVVDENRRATYNISTQPVVRSESVFTTFDSEIKQFVAVGLHAEYSYARSLARFCGNLGSVAWKVASKRIEQALPEGCKFGRGWVGEYEPLPTPVLLVENSTQNQSALASKFYSCPELRKDDRTLRTSVPAKEHPVTEERQHSVSVPTSGGRPSFLGSTTRGQYSEGKPTVIRPVGAKPNSTVNPQKNLQSQFREPEKKVQKEVELNPIPSVHPQKNPQSRFIEPGKKVQKAVELNSIPSVNSQNKMQSRFIEPEKTVQKEVELNSIPSVHPQKNLQSRYIKPEKKVQKAAESNSIPSVNPQKKLQSRFVEPEKKVQKEVELNSIPSVNHNNANLVAEKQSSRKSEAEASRPRDTVSRNMNLPQPVPFKMPDSNGNVNRGLPNGKNVSASLDNRMISPSDSAHTQMDRTAAFFPHGQVQGHSDSVQFLKNLAEKNQKQHKSSSQKQHKSSSQSSVDTQPIGSSVPSVRRDDSGNAAAAAARAWMSIGAGAFNQPTEDLTKPKSQISADSLYNPARDFQSQISRVRGEFPMQFQTQNSFSFPTFLQQPVRMANEAHFQGRPTVFPQLPAADLSRFQAQSPWRGLSPTAQPRPKQKQESLPPDLNIGFQSPGSPVKQSSSLLADSQQPDLALQL